MVFCMSRHWVLVQQGQKRTLGSLELELTDGFVLPCDYWYSNLEDSGRAACALNCRAPAFF